MSIVLGIRKGKRRQRGGRRKAGQPEYNKVKHHIVIDDELMTLIEAEREPEETYNETVWRMIKRRTAKIQELQKKVDALESELCQETTLTLITPKPKAPETIST